MYTRARAHARTHARVLEDVIKVGGANDKAELQKRTEEITAQLASLFSLYEQREIEINTGAKTLSTRVSAAIANIEKEKAAADEELKMHHCAHL